MEWGWGGFFTLTQKVYDMSLDTTHDATLSSILNCPTMMDSMVDAAEEIQRNLVSMGIVPKNLMVHGACMDAMIQLYQAGERRGILREQSMFAGLYPQTPKPRKRKPAPDYVI